MNKSVIFLLIFIPGLWTAGSAYSQDTTVVLSSSMFDHEQLIYMGELEGWVFRAGNDPAWADPELDTSNWERMRPTDLTIAHAGESGIFEGWFRLSFTIDATFADMPLGWRSGTFGAMDLYLDGVRVHAYGNPDRDPGHHQSFNPYNQIPDSADLEIGREYVLAFYLVDHHSSLVSRYTLREVRLDPLLRLTGPEYTEYIRTARSTIINFYVLWITALFLLTFLFWVISFQSAGEYLLRLIAWVNTLFLISAVASYSQIVAANLIYMEFTQLIFALSIHMIIGMVPMVISQMMEGKISRWLKWLFWITLLVGVIVYMTDQVVQSILALLFVIGICIVFVWRARKRILTSQWMVIGGLGVTNFWMLVYLLQELVVGAPHFLVQFILVTGIYLTLPISLILFISLRYREILIETQNSAREVVQLTNEKLAAEKEKQIVAARQQKILEKEVESRTQELSDSLENLKATQEQLVQQEKLASLGQLTAGIAHEIKNPLNFVNNFSEVSLELVDEARDEVRQVTEDRGPGKKSPFEGGAGAVAEVGDVADPDKEKNSEADPNSVNTPLNPSSHRDPYGARVEAESSPDTDLILEILDDIEANLRKIHEHGSRADSIVKSMLQHSRGGDGKMEPTPLNPLIKEYVNLAFHGMRAGKEAINVDIDLQLGENVGEVPLIAEDFSRVILNLCNNAFDAMRSKLTEDGRPKTGNPNDQAPNSKRYSPKLTVRTRSENGSIIIEIEDNGPGIPDEIKDKILQPFFTTKKGTQGTGLGLSITNDIIKAHGGELSVNTIAGQCTTFTIGLHPNNT